MADQVIPEKVSETMYDDSFSNPAVMARNVVANDSADLDPPARALRVGVAGDVTIKNMRDETVLFTAVQPGEIILCFVKRLMDTGTDATDFVAYYG